MEILSLQDIKHRALLPAYDESPIDGLIKWHCENLAHYLTFQDQVHAFNQELKSINSTLEDLDDIRVRNWCLKAKYIFNEVFFKFTLDFCDHKDSTEDLICINVEDYFVNKKDIIDLYVFANLNWILYFGEYYKAPEDRTKPDPNIDETQGYYYSPPDPNAPTEMESVKALLELI